MNKGLKIITLDATDLFQYDTKTKQVVSSNLTQFYQMKDENGNIDIYGIAHKHNGKENKN